MEARSHPVLGTPREWAIRLTVAVAVGVFFGAIGPFGTYDSPLVLRVAEWTLGACLGVAVFTVTVRSARWWAPRLDVPDWFAIGVAVALAAAPYSAALGLLFSGRVWLHGGWPTRLEFYGDCLIIAAPMTVVALLMSRYAPKPASCEPAFETSQPVIEQRSLNGAGLLAMLPPRLGRELIALQMEDHYVRAHTPLGSDLLLMPMSQATEALTAIDGLRVHRSWWVARSAVQGVAWEGRNLRLRLTGGLEAPVSRNQVAPLRAAGWLGADASAEPQRLGSTS